MVKESREDISMSDHIHTSFDQEATTLSSKSQGGNSNNYNNKKFYRLYINVMWTEWKPAGRTYEFNNSVM